MNGSKGSSYQAALTYHSTLLNVRLWLWVQLIETFLLPVMARLYFIMNRIIYILLTLLFCNLTYGETLGRDDLSGVWRHQPNRFSSDTISLEIGDDLSVSFSRRNGLGLVHACVASAASVRYIGDLYIFECQPENGPKYKLALSGWHIGKLKSLFGTMYMYANGNLFNGVQVLFKAKYNQTKKQ